MGDIRKDQSMEDILASIKRVIEEDARAAVSARAAPPARSFHPAPPPVDRPSVEPPAPDEDILELDDPVSEANGLMSPDAAAASRQSLAALSMLNDPPAAPVAAAPAGPLEDVVRDMLRPMLKDWLDQNLPEIVEQLVTREIARITGKSL